MTDIDTDALRALNPYYADPGDKGLIHAAADALDRYQQPLEGELAEIEGRVLGEVPRAAVLHELKHEALLERIAVARIDRKKLHTALKQVTAERENLIATCMANDGLINQLRAELERYQQPLEGDSEPEFKAAWEWLHDRSEAAEYDKRLSTLARLFHQVTAELHRYQQPLEGELAEIEAEVSQHWPESRAKQTALALLTALKQVTAERDALYNETQAKRSTNAYQKIQLSMFARIANPKPDDEYDDFWSSMEHEYLNGDHEKLLKLRAELDAEKEIAAAMEQSLALVSEQLESAERVISECGNEINTDCTDENHCLPWCSDCKAVLEHRAKYPKGETE